MAFRQVLAGPVRAMAACAILWLQYSALTPEDVHTEVIFTAMGTALWHRRLPSPTRGERFL